MIVFVVECTTAFIMDVADSIELARTILEREAAARGLAVEWWDDGRIIANLDNGIVSHVATIHQKLLKIAI